MVHYDSTQDISDDEGGSLDHLQAIHDAKQMTPQQVRAFHKTASVIDHLLTPPEADPEKATLAHLATLGPVKSMDGGGFFGDLWNGIKSAASTVWKGIKTVAKPLIDVAGTIGPIVATALGAPELAPVISMAAGAASQALGGGFADPDHLASTIVEYMQDGKGGGFDSLVAHIVKHSHKDAPHSPFKKLAESKCQSCIVKAIERDHREGGNLLPAIQVTKRLMPHVAKAL